MPDTQQQDKTYDIRLKGEVHSFRVADWEGLSLDSVCNVLSDVTGYKPDYIRRTIIEDLIDNKPRVVNIIHAQGWGGQSTPSFIVQENQPAKVTSDRSVAS